MVAAMNKDFYDSLHDVLYPNGVAVLAMATLDAIWKQAAALKVPLNDVAYMMATAYHEVGPALLPKRENLNYSVDALLGNFSRARISAADAQRLGRKAGEGPLSEARQVQIANLVYGGPWGAKNLGNTQPADGWRFRGGGFPQTTGRANFGKVGQLVGVDLLARPDLITQMDIAVHALVVCMIKGTYTGKKLSDYSLPAQFRDARAIINPDVAKNGEKIAGHARQFAKALTKGGYQPGLPFAAAPAPAASVDIAELIPVMPDPPKRVSASTVVSTTGLGASVLLVVYQLHDAITAKACAWLSLFCGG